MERQTKLNNVSAVLFLLSLTISVFIFAIYDKPASGINENLLLPIFFAPPVFLIISLILSIISLIIKKNIKSILLIAAVVIGFVPLCYIQIFIILCGITGYHG